MTDEQTKPDTQGAEVDGDAGQRQKAQADLAQHLTDNPIDSTATPSGSGQQGAVEGGKATPDAPTLTNVQIEAVTAAGFKPEEILAMGPQGIERADRMVKARADISRFASKAGHLETDNKALKAAAEAGDTPSKAMAEIESEESSDYDDDRPKIKQNFQNTEQRLAALEAGHVAGGTTETSDSDGMAEKDQYFDGLREQGWTQFGEGPMSALPEFSQEAIARKDIVIMADSIMAGSPGTDSAVALNAALSAQYSAEHSNAAVQGEVAKAQAQEAGSVEPPSGRAPVQDSPNAREDTRSELEVNLARVDG